jgi:putative sterol carrier protein
MADEQELAQLAEGSDDEVAEKIHAAGTQEVLDGVFEGMPARFQPEKASGVDAQAQWLISDSGEEHPYAVTVADGTCTTERARVESPRVTFLTDVVSFARLMTGKAQGPQLYMAGKLKIQGDLMLAQRMATFFAPLS